MGLFDAFKGDPARKGAIGAVDLARTQQQAANSDIQRGLGESLDAYGNAYNTSTGAIAGGVDAAQRAALTGYQTANQALNTGYGNATNVADQGFTGASQYLNQGYGQGRSDLTGGSSQAMDIYGRGGQQASGYIGTGQGQQLGAVNQGYGSGLKTLGGISGTFDPYSTTGAVAQTTLGGALGLGSAADQAAARSRFQAAPGYQYAVEQGLDQTNRAAAASGGIGGGNQLTALQNRAQGMADQGWNSWLSNLSGVGQTGLQAAGQQANAQTNLAGAQIGQGTAQANIYGTTAAQQAAIAQQTAAQQGGLAYNTGQALSAQDAQQAQLQAQNAANRGTTLGGYNIGQGTAQANLASNYGTQNANLNLGLGQSLSNLAQNYGTQQGGAYNTATAQNVYQDNLLTNQGMGAINQGALAGQQASATGLNTILGLGGTALKLGSLGTGGGNTLGGSLIGGAISGFGDWLGQGAGGGGSNLWIGGSGGGGQVP